MRRKIGFYSVVLTSVVCMLGWSGDAFSAVRMLGTNNNGTSNTTTSTSSTGSTTTASTRGSSLRFTPMVTTKTGSSAQPYSGLSTSKSSGAVDTSNNSSARLSIGKYLNLSHTNKLSPSNSSSSSSSYTDIDNLRTEIDTMKTQIENLKETKNSLIVSNNEYIEIAGDDNNVISIDIEALRSDLQGALGTDKEILINRDEDYNLWWCYANDAKNACVGDRQLIVDLGTILNGYNLAIKNTSVKEALEGKQGILNGAPDGYIEINQNQGTVDVKFEKLKNALHISNARQSEIRFTHDGKLQWRYSDEYEADDTTPKWNTADVATLINNSLNNYVQTETLNNYVKKTELGGFEGTLVEAPDGYIQIENNLVDVKFEKLKEDLDIPADREIEMEITNAGVLRWRYVGDTNWTNVGDIGSLVDGKLLTYVDNTYLETVLNNYITENDLGDYATEEYVDTAVATRQAKLSEADNGFIKITPVSGGDEIGIKFDELRTALDIPPDREIAMHVVNGVLEWRYLTDVDENDEPVWTTVYDLKNLLNGYVTENNFNTVISRIDNDLAGKQIKLTATENGGILLTETGEISVDIETLYELLDIPENTARTTQIRVDNNVLQWRYTDEYDDNDQEIWHSYDLSGDFVTTDYLENYYYDKTYIDSLAETIETTINNTLETLNDRPTDTGLYLLSVEPGEAGEDNKSTWQTVHIVDENSVVH